MTVFGTSSSETSFRVTLYFLMTRLVLSIILYSLQAHASKVLCKTQSLFQAPRPGVSLFLARFNFTKLSSRFSNTASYGVLRNYLHKCNT